MLDPLPPPPAETFTTTTSNNHFRGILSYDGNIMLAAVISLLLVILFVLLLHVYAKWFLVQARQRSRRSVSVPQVLGPRFHSLITIDTTYADHDESPTKGLESSDISEIPMFVYKVGIDNIPKNNNESILECAICLSLFEDEEIGRRLPKCGHVFHVECIDMWFHSHSTCPICRDPVVAAAGNLIVDSVNDEVNIVDCDLNEEPLISSVEEEMINGQETLLEIIVEVPNPENANISRKDSISVCSS